jgi:hypothetical protein
MSQTGVRYINTFMYLDYYGPKHAGLYRISNNRNYRNCGPAQIPV